MLTPRVSGYFQKKKQPKAKILRAACSFLVSTFSATLGAMVFTVPLTAYYFGVFSVAAPFASLVCIPLASGNFWRCYWASCGCQLPMCWGM